jgi:hypothetical protein
MTLKRLLLAAAYALVAAPVLVAAQVVSPPGTSSPHPKLDTTPGPTKGSPIRDPAAMGKLMDRSDAIRSISGEVVQVDIETGSIVVADLKKGVHGTFYVNKKTKLSADKETTLGGKKKLTLEDFQKGQTVKVTYWTQEDADWTVTLRALEVRARRPKN